MQAFTVRVEGHKPGMKPLGDEFKVNAENEMTAAELAKLKAREKWLEYQGVIPVVRGVRASGSAFELEPSTHKPVPIQGAEPEEKTKAADDPDFADLAPENQIRVRKYADWRAMKNFRLMAYARKAVAGQSIEVKDKTTALRILQERNLVAP
jgi:hypothetical protein